MYTSMTDQQLVNMLERLRLSTSGSSVKVDKNLLSLIEHRLRELLRLYNHIEEALNEIKPSSKDNN